MAIDIKYLGAATVRKWTNSDGCSFELVSDETGVQVKMTISKESDLETAKAQLNMAIQDWRTYRAKSAGRQHAGTVTNNLTRE